ncbi:MAG: hypothetical protein GX214_03730 [Clostridiales bacterium]|nr:hypothetical protein [Clostridiales bacterium]
MLNKNKSKIINIDTYLKKRKEAINQNKKYNNYNHVVYRYVDDEDRINTYKLCMRVIATMEKESYK